MHKKLVIVLDWTGSEHGMALFYRNQNSTSHWLFSGAIISHVLFYSLQQFVLELVLNFEKHTNTIFVRIPRSISKFSGVVLPKTEIALPCFVNVIAGLAFVTEIHVSQWNSASKKGV